MTIKLDFIKDYETAKVIQASREEAYKAASDRMETMFGHLRRLDGSTPDAIKFSTEYKVEKIAVDFAFAAVREINGYINKNFKKERRAEPRAFKRPVS